MKLCDQNLNQVTNEKKTDGLKVVLYDKRYGLQLEELLKNYEKKFGEESELILEN